MNSVLLIARRDLAAYLHGITGWVIVAAVLFVDGLLFNALSLGNGARYSHEVLGHFFYFASGTTMIAAVLLAMRTFAEEAQVGTDFILRTAPVAEWQVVLGKYLAALGMLGVLTLFTVYMPAQILVHGKISLAHVAVGYTGLMFLGSATLAIGMFGSSLFRSQMAAAIVSGVVVVTLLVLWHISELTDPPFTDVLAAMTLHDKHFIPFQEGRLLVSNLVFYASVTAGFLVLAARSLEGRRWR